MAGPEGRVYVFDCTTLERRLTLTSDDPNLNMQFGLTLATGDNLVAVGEGGGFRPETVYIFDIETGLLLNSISASLSEDFTEMDLVLDSGRLFVGDPFYRVSGLPTGIVLVFDPLNGARIGEISPATIRSGDYCGSGVAARNGQIYLSATGISGAFAQEGRVFRFDPYSEFEVDPAPLVSLRGGTFSMIGARPNERTWMLYSVDGLASNAVYIRRLNVFTSLEMPHVAWGPLLSDEEGDLVLSARIGAIPGPIDIWFQIVQKEFVSNWVKTEIVPD